MGPFVFYRLENVKCWKNKVLARLLESKEQVETRCWKTLHNFEI